VVPDTSSSVEDGAVSKGRAFFVAVVCSELEPEPGSRPSGARATPNPNGEEGPLAGEAEGVPFGTLLPASPAI